MAMDLAMMAPTQRHGELIADLAPERPALREAQMVGIRRLAAANEASLRGDESLLPAGSTTVYVKSSAHFSGGPKRFDAFSIFGFEISLRHFQIVMGLQIHPEFRTITKVQAQPKRRIGCDAPSIVYDFSDAIGRNANGLCKLILR
jgi:hypothetical protein